MVNNRSNAKYIAHEALKTINGLGTSKSQSRSHSELKGQNGHAISSKIHSLQSFKQVSNIAEQYTSYLQQEYGKKEIIDNINAETMKDFITRKLENEEISGGTANTYISAMAKLAEGFNRLEIQGGERIQIDRADVTNLRQELKADNHDLHKGYENRAYSADQINDMRSYMQDTAHLLSFDLQREAGLRVDDATHSDKWTINDDNTITIHGSKNGLDYTTRELPQELINRATEAKESGYQVAYSTYRTELIEAGADKGSHGLRYTYAQERYAELKAEGNTNLKARAQVSQEMGHSRDEITLHYLG